MRPERDLEFYSRAWVEEGPSRGDFDPPGKYSLHKNKPQGLENVVDGTITEAIFMGDSYQCKVAVGDDIVAVHTHPFNAVSVGEKVYLHLDPASCNGLPADDKEVLMNRCWGLECPKPEFEEVFA
jgi:hypothetical protein